ncbi:MFS transporter, partial [Vibrio breoganii]
NHNIDKASSTAGMYIYSYVGFSIPVITSGFIAQRFGNWMAILSFLTLLLALCFIIVVGKLIEGKKQTHFMKVKS